MTFGTVRSRSQVLLGFGLALLLTAPAGAQDSIDGIIGFNNGGLLRYDPATPDPGYTAGPLNDFGVAPLAGMNPLFPNTDWQPDASTIALGLNDQLAEIVPPVEEAGCDNCNSAGNNWGRNFEQFCYRGAIDPEGVDWTQGWTVSGINTSIKPADWPTRPIKILNGIQPVANITFDADTIYAFIGKVTIPAGATLTIEPGTLCIGENASSGYLTIDRGAQIFANGTANDPIIMTTDLDPPIVGGWGGLVIHGRAVANCADCLGGASCISEGGAGEFCGTDDCDDSGSMSYVVLGYAGVDIGVDNELNAFTFNGVGSNSDFHHLQAHQGKDDLFEWFGGKCNLRYAVGTGGGDDGVDWQMGFRGTVQNVVIQRYPIQDGDKCIEADNNENGFDAVCRSRPLIANATFIGSNGGGIDTYGVHFRRGTDVTFVNSIICYTNDQAIRISDDPTVARGIVYPPTANCAPVDAPEIANFTQSDLRVRTFPNPVVSSARFSFYMPVAGSARLDVYDVRGRLVENVMDSELASGSHTIDWSPANGLVAGTYFYRLENDIEPVTGKLVVVR
jgi:hypothetical protein